MSFHTLKTILLLILILVLPNFFVSAQEDLEKICRLEEIEKVCDTSSQEECRKLLEKCEKFYQEKSDDYKQDIKKTQAEKKTLQNTIYILETNIKKLDNQIYEGNVIVKDLSFQIKDTESSIVKTSSKIEDSKEKLTQVLRKIYEEDQGSLMEIFLAEDKFSDFFNDMVALEELSAKNQELLEQIKSLKIYLKDQKQSLDEEKDETEKVVRLQNLQKQESKNTKQEKEYFLNITKGKESEYQKLLQETQQKASEIRSRIFDLIGVSDAPTFGEAVDIAKVISAQTGIRPAFLLAILQQESNIGKNVGQCYLKNTSSGSGVVISTGRAVSRVMKPSRDIQPFLQITKDLGRDPLNTPVSCPMSYGYGGAMGPAQFIPSTWNIYRSRLSGMLGRPADPWNIRDAFLASAVFLVDLGANRDIYGAEWCAAVSYFSGNCSRKNQIAYEFYGDNVRAIANKFEEEIKLIE